MPKYIAWREGLFIRPQHFQQNNYTINLEMMQRSIMGGSNKWGLFNLEIDDQLLGMGKLSITSASGILPDGTLFESSDFPEHLTLDIKKTDNGKAIYLSLPLNYANEDNIYFEEQEEMPTRYVAKTHREISNTNMGEESKADILFAYPNFKLKREDEKIDGYTSIQIALIGNVTVNNIVSLDKDFIPTYLHLHQAKVLMENMHELQGMLQYRIERIIEKVSGKGLESTELRDYLILQVLNRVSTRLHFFETQEKIHPSELYLELVTAIGDLSVFMKKEKSLKEQYTYVHTEQNSCFNTVFTEVKKLLSLVLESKSVLIPIDKHNYGLRIALLKDKAILNNSFFVLAISSNIDENKLKKLLLDNLKIGTVDEIRNLVNHHLPGFSIKPLTTAPREIPYKVNQSYYRIIIKPEDKQKLLKTSGIALHYPETEILHIDFLLWAIKES
ncbi:MAG: type VI secretion system baseplate subunit TssK [Sulfurovum sp.]|nr:type VI secretion system baseplate subunit TssK [Sulfurovum sp.]